MLDKLEDGQPSYFATEIKNAQRVVHRIAAEHGFWEKDRNNGEMIALMHSELSEALEAIRKDEFGTPSEHIPEHSAVAEEMADVVIRVLDFCHVRKIDLGAAIIAKVNFNNARPYKHGKKF